MATILRTECPLWSKADIGLAYGCYRWLWEASPSLRSLAIYADPLRTEQRVGRLRHRATGTGHLLKEFRGVGGWWGKNCSAARLPPDGSWREPDIASIGASIGVGRDKDQLEYLVGTQTQQIEGLKDEVERLRNNWSNGSDVDVAGVAISSLVQIVANSDSTMHQRIRAVATILGYKTDDAVTRL